jgi:hypothetical protein
MAEDEGGTITEIASRREAERLGQNGTGRSIEDLAEETPEDEVGQQLLDFGDQLNLSLKGKKPSESKLKIRTIQMDIRGQLGDKGDDEDYAFIVVGRLNHVGTPYKRDEQGRTMSKKRVHELTPMDVQRIPPELLEEFMTRCVGEE